MKNLQKYDQSKKTFRKPYDIRDGANENRVIINKRNRKCSKCKIWQGA